MNFSKIQNIFWRIAKHHCSIFVILVGFALLWGGFLFFNNFVLLKEATPPIVSPGPLLDREAYQEVAEILETREENLKNIELKDYLNPFREAVLLAE